MNNLDAYLGKWYDVAVSDQKFEKAKLLLLEPNLVAIECEGQRVIITGTAVTLTERKIK